MDVAVQGLDLLRQDLVAGLLAEEHEQFADGAVDQLPLLGLVLAGLASDGFRASGRLELFDSGFDHLCCDLATASFFNGKRLGLLRLFGSQAD
jgi:hypothetical protein